MMSPVTNRVEVEVAALSSEPTETATSKKELTTEDTPVTIEPQPGTLKLVHRNRSGAAKLDAALQALNEQPVSQRGTHHRSSNAENEQGTGKRESKKNNSKNSSRASEESIRSEGRKSSDGGSRRSQDGVHSRSADSQRSTTSEPLQQDDTSDQLTQITDILLARLITTLSDSTLGNPALLLQTLLGFSPDDYNDLLAALSESRLSYVDIISAYLHNIKVMSEDSGSTSAALSGTLTRSLIEQYNSLLAQAVKSPQNIARATLIGDTEGRSHLADLLQKANATESKSERRSFESLLPKGPSGLGFGRRHSADSNKQRQQQQGLISSDAKTTMPSTTDSGMIMDFSKIFGTAPKLPVGSDLNANVVPPQQGNGMGNITQEQLAALLQSTGMLGGGGSPYSQQQQQHQQPPPHQQQQQQHNVPSLPFLPNTAGHVSGMLALNNPYVMHQMQPWTVPMQQYQMTGPTPNRNGMGWQGPTTMGFQQPSNLFRGWGGAGLETVHENFHGSLQQPDPSCFSQAINMQPQHGQP